MKFTEFGFHADLMEGLDAMGFEQATPVQEQAIPLIMQNRDVLACAQTGTGKTAAFLLPVINNILNSPTEGVDTLIVEPTRELAVQVDQQLEGFSYFTSISATAVYGGRGRQEMEQEKKALERGADIIIATPGRLLSHLKLGYIKLDSVKHLILDEADRMLDMGFAPDIMDIVNRLPRERQTLLFSATMPNEIRRFARQLLKKDPEEINIAISKPAENIMQGAYEVEDNQKIELCKHLLQGKKNLERVLIFASTKIKVRELAQNLKNEGLNVGAVHSDLEQSEREAQVLKFKSGNLPIIVATDVLSRGIDIKGIDVVINYDVPSDAEDYVHRIGRTARADASGVALTFINGPDRSRFRKIEEFLGSEVRRIPLPGHLPPPQKSSRPPKGRGGRYTGKGRPYKGRKK